MLIPARTIGRKRDGETLSPKELQALLTGFDNGIVSDAQMAAFLMAVSFRGLVRSELDVLVDTMMGSGSIMRRRSNTRSRVDKHSTGGVGDKVSLVLAPLAAEMGLEVPMMSGRGLGHTGGTLDKLESIPGFNTTLALEAFEDVIEAHGTAMIGQTDEIAPLDRRLYALRSVTGTVPAIPLIASSIMSKKLAEDLDGLVLDVKVGAGSFLRDAERTQELAETMVDIGRSRGVPTVALLTRMDWPIGKAIGNSLEVAEAVGCLGGKGPSDLAELTARLVGEMLVLGGLETHASEGAERAREILADGTALVRFRAMVVAQDGDPQVVDHPDRLLEAASRTTVLAAQTGIVSAIDPTALGWGVVELGGGRSKPEDTVDLTVGFQMDVTVGDSVLAGQPLGWVHAADEAGAARGKEVLEAAVEVRPTSSPNAGESPRAPLVVGRIGP